MFNKDAKIREYLDGTEAKMRAYMRAATHVVTALCIIPGDQLTKLDRANDQGLLPDGVRAAVAVVLGRCRDEAAQVRRVFEQNTPVTKADPFLSSVGKSAVYQAERLLEIFEGLHRDLCAINADPGTWHPREISERIAKEAASGLEHVRDITRGRIPSYPLFDGTLVPDASQLTWEAGERAVG